MNCKERSPLYNASLLYKLSELERRMKDYISFASSNDDFTNDVKYTEHIQKQYEIVSLLLQIIEEINVLKILSNYLLQLKIHRIHYGWTGRATKTFSG
jgi:hypothetical protein